MRHSLHGTNATNEIQILKHEHKKAIFKALQNKWNEIWSRDPTSELHNFRESTYDKTPDFELHNIRESTYEKKTRFRNKERPASNHKT